MGKGVGARPVGSLNAAWQKPPAKNGFGKKKRRKRQEARWAKMAGPITITQTK